VWESPIKISNVSSEKKKFYEFLTRNNLQHLKLWQKKAKKKIKMII